MPKTKAAKPTETESPSKRVSLYHMAAEIIELMECVQDHDGEINAEVLERLQGSALSFEEKLQHCAMAIRDLKSRADACKAEAKRLNDRAKASANAADRILAYMSEQMEAVGLEKSKGELFTIAFQANPPAVVIDDESAIPAAFWIPPPPVIDKAGIKERLKDGCDVPGCRLEQSKSLRIR